MDIKFLWYILEKSTWISLDVNKGSNNTYKLIHEYSKIAKVSRRFLLDIKIRQ